MKEIINIIPATFRRKGIVVAITLLLRAILNFLGLAVLIPVLMLVLDPGSVAEGGAMAKAYTYLGFSSQIGFAYAICTAVVVIIAVKCLINLWLTRFERDYVYSLYRTLSRRLYVTYYNRGLSFIKSSNSAVLARNINIVCSAFTTGVLRAAAAIAVELMLMLFIFTTILVYTPLAALLAGAIFVPAIWVYYAVARSRLNKYGIEENKAQREKARIVGETFRGYADIEINDAFPKMLHSFDESMEKVIQIGMKSMSLEMLPNILIEVGIALGMAAMVAYGTGTGDTKMQLLFGVFAVAALKLRPSIKNIMSSWTAIKYNRYTIDILKEANFDEKVPEYAEATLELMPFDREIAVRDLSFCFADNGAELFSGLSLSIAKGEHVGIRGVSGAGKTTLFNLLLGLYEPTGGEITIDGTPLSTTNRRKWQNRIGYVSQSLFIVDGSFAANVALGVPEAEIDNERVMQALQTAQLGDFIASLPNGAATHVGECGCRLSGGQRQRIGIARALYRRADVLFFDEATSALDSRTEEDINRSISQLAARNKELTLVVIAHRESSLEYCDRIITIG